MLFSKLLPVVLQDLINAPPDDPEPTNVLLKMLCPPPVQVSPPDQIPIQALAPELATVRLLYMLKFLVLDSRKINAVGLPDPKSPWM
jgi:hypothetical protein